MMCKTTDASHAPRRARMMRRAAAVPIAALALCIAGNALAQTRPAAPNAGPSSGQTSDARAAQLKQQADRWQALSEADRKSVQDSLVWVGLYNGVVDGAFGQRTADAIANFEKASLLQPGAVISGPGLAVLRAAANKEKTAVGFTLIDDAATGARIGVPTRLLEQRESKPGRTRLSSSKSPASLTLFAGGPDDGDLPAWFERATNATAAGRKVTYKILRPDFAVVTSNEGDRRFFTRVAAGPDGLRGFTFVYPAAAAAAMDRLTIAIANSFAPFAGQPGAITTGAPPAPAPSPAQQPSPVAAAANGQLVGTALLVGTGRAITATAAVAGCKQIRIGAAPATVSASDRQGGLSLLASQATTPRTPNPVMLASTVQPGDVAILAAFVAGADGAAQLYGMNGELAATPGAVVAALQPGAPGALALDHNGALIGMVAALSPGPAVNGVRLVATHRLAATGDVARMLTEAGAPPTATAASAVKAPAGKDTPIAGAATASSGGGSAEGRGQHGDGATPASTATNAGSTGAALAQWRARLAPVYCLN